MRDRDKKKADEMLVTHLPQAEPDQEGRPPTLSPAEELAGASLDELTMRLQATSRPGERAEILAEIYARPKLQRSAAVQELAGLGGLLLSSGDFQEVPGGSEGTGSLSSLYRSGIRGDLLPDLVEFEQLDGLDETGWHLRRGAGQIVLFIRDRHFFRQVFSNPLH